MNLHVSQGSFAETSPRELRVENLGLESVLANSLPGQSQHLPVDDDSSHLSVVGEEVGELGEGRGLVEVLHGHRPRYDSLPVLQ